MYPKKTLPFFAALALGVPALSAFAAPNATDAEISAAEGEYVVLVSENTLKEKDWLAVAQKFAKKHNAKIVGWRGNGVSAAKKTLKKLQPRYVAVVARPQEIDRVFVAGLHVLSREMNDDIYGDFIWGIVTGKDPETAASLLAKDEPLVLDRALGTTNFDQKRFKKSFFITDWGPREYVETENYVSSEKTSVAAGTEMIDVFAQRWAENQPQFLMTASHATEFNLEMPFGEGLIASAGTDFYRVPKPLMRDFVYVMGKEEKTRDFIKNYDLKKLPESTNDKVWFASGNCLFGDTLRTPFSMAVTAISSAGVKQLVGYTVPSWFGEGGWGSSGQFFGGHQATSVGQAWFFNNQILLKNLPESVVKTPLIFNPHGMDNMNMAQIFNALWKANLEGERANVGRLHDRDTVAFYGDPLYRTRFNPDAPSTQPWDCRVVPGKTQAFAVKTTRGNAYKGDFCLWFPKRLIAAEKFAAEISGKKNKAVEPDILTENFVIFRGLELGEGETLKLRVPAKK